MVSDQEAERAQTEFEKYMDSEFPYGWKVLPEEEIIKRQKAYTAGARAENEAIIEHIKHSGGFRNESCKQVLIEAIHARQEPKP